jgi:type VI secretion system secreted protein Hcp
MMIRLSHRFSSLLAAALLAAPAFAASDYFLVLDGIPGESNDRAHPAAIEIVSFSFGAANSGRVGAPGTGAGKVSFSDISFSKVIDKASPLLYLRTANGARIPKATLFLRKLSSNKVLEYYTVTLSDVLVTGMATSGNSGGGVPSESFSLSFGKIEFSYRPQKADGSLDAPIKSGWDVVSNRAL